jgi:[ribosomal protein S5]-alanine N-acetyltransferase
MPSPRARRRRLVAERPWLEHLDLYVDLFGDEPVAGYLWPGAHGGARTADQAGEILAGDVEHWQRESFGPWLFFEGSTGLFVGRGGLRRTTLDGGDYVEVLYAVRSDVWGHGYGGEMATFAVTQARVMGLREVVGFVAVENIPSQRVMERGGLRFESVFERARLPHRLARISFHPASPGTPARAKTAPQRSSRGRAREDEKGPVRERTRTTVRAQTEGRSSPRAE